MTTPLTAVAGLALAVAGALALARHKRPLVIPAMLIAGVLLGPYGTRLVQDVGFFDATRDIGLVLFLFFTGLFAPPRAMQDGGRPAIALAAYDFVLHFAAAFWIGGLFDWDLPTRLLLGGILATTSTGAILKVMGDEGRLHQREGKVLVALLWIENMAFIVLYLVLGGQAAFTQDPLKSLALLGLFAAALVVLRTSRGALWKIRHPEVLVPVLAFLGLVVAGLGAAGGLPVAGAAFTAGFALSDQRTARLVTHEVPWIREITAALFFFGFGAHIDPMATLTVLPVVGLALVSIFVVELLFIPQVARLLGLNSTQSLIVGGNLLSRGGRSASFAQLGAERASPDAQRLPGVAGVLALILTPLAPLMVRLVLKVRRGAADPAFRPRRRDALSLSARRALAAKRQGDALDWQSVVQRAPLVMAAIVPAELGIIGALLPDPWRWVVVAVAALLLIPAYGAMRLLLQTRPPRATRDPATSTDRPDRWLPALLMVPVAWIVALPVLGTLSSLAVPVAAGLTLLYVWLLPVAAHPRRPEPPWRRLQRKSPDPAPG